jgi:hypothetical protein
MLSRTLITLAGLILVSAIAIARDDEISKKINDVLLKDLLETSEIKDAVTKQLELKEEKARAAGNKKLADEIKMQKEELANLNNWPTDMPEELRTRLTKTRMKAEEAYKTGIKEYRAAKKDKEATELEMQYKLFQGYLWPHITLTARTEIKDGYFRIPADATVESRIPYKGGVEITAVAKVDTGNIRLNANRGSVVIFNWEVKPGELRVCRPDGRAFSPESGTIATAKVTPLKANTYYTLKWRLTPEGMTVSENDKVVFTEKKKYDLDFEHPISISAVKGPVDVKEFKITRILP